MYDRYSLNFLRSFIWAQIRRIEPEVVRILLHSQDGAVDGHLTFEQEIQKAHDFAKRKYQERNHNHN